MSKDRDLDAERLDPIIALAWRPAWSMRRRVGCLAPLIAWWRRWRASGKGG